MMNINGKITRRLLGSLAYSEKLIGCDLSAYRLKIGRCHFKCQNNIARDQKQVCINDNKLINNASNFRSIEICSLKNKQKQKSVGTT